MLDLRQVSEDFAVAPQIAPEDVAELAAQGYQRIICNRPDGEEPGQPTLAEMKAATEAAGLEWLAIPITSPPPDSAVIGTMEALEDGRKTFAYCRSGTRSVTLWALARIHSGALSREEALAAARKAGYTLG